MKFSLASHRVTLCAWLYLCCSVLPAAADQTSRGINGIHVPGGLNGSGVTIGQVEGGRPAVPGLDTIARHPNVTPTAVFNGFTAPIGDNLWEMAETAAPIPPFNQNHAENVAGVMIWTDPNHTGIATGASLVASASSPPSAGTLNFLSAKSALSAQQLHIGRTVRAINMSFGIGALAAADGTSLMTQYVDWAARNYNTVYVTAGDETGPPAPGAPSDQFNGINVGFTRQVGSVFRQVDAGNIFTTDGNRRLTDIVAPGRSIQMPSYTGGSNVSSGTSFAAPHVTGTVALLQQYAAQQIAANNPDFQGFPRRHEVMKAVLLNSADKIKDDGTYVHGGNPVRKGDLLGMEKTIVATDGVRDWLHGDAFTSESKPLDLQMGTGQLNASRALTQFTPGEWDPGMVPVIGWDLGVTTGAGATSRYQIDTKLRGGSFISVTLAWDRIINLNDTLVANGQFDAEVFKDTGIPGVGTPATGLGGGNSGGFTYQDIGPDGLPGTADPGEGNGMHDPGEPSEPFNDVNGNGTYAFATESFAAAGGGTGLTDLDIYLFKRGEANLANRLVGSLSNVDSAEHIFFQIPQNGLYDIVVRQPFGGVQAFQDYGLAWWSVPVPEPTAFLLALVAGCGSWLMSERRRKRG